MTELNASRGLDALVAEKVMGWVRVVDEPRLIGEWYRPPDYPMTAATCEVPRYSTEIGAAWSVVERMRADGWTLEFSNQDGAYAMFWKKYDRVNGVASSKGTAPEALCRAALAAVGAQRGEK